MKEIFTERNGRKRYTKEEVAYALASLNSSEPGDVTGNGEKVTYFLHVDDEGNILRNSNGEDECFIYTIDIDEYKISKEDVETYGFDDDGNFAWWDSSFLPDRENLDCKAFAECVDSLTDEVNQYIDNIDE